MEGFIVFIVFFCPPALWVVIDFLKFLVTRRRLFSPLLTKYLAVIIIVLLQLFFVGMFDFGPHNDCCIDNVMFSPEHRLTFYCWVEICSLAFVFSTFRKEMFPPILEVALNCLLLLGILLNIAMASHVGTEIWPFGNLPIGLLFVMAMMENQQKVVEMAENDAFDTEKPLAKFCGKVLRLPVFAKYPVLLVLCLPIILIVTGFLLLFGQKPDSIIRAFTDTYKHGFSQLDHLCDNVNCGGHYLCSVAANGHKSVVKPLRYGIRGGRLIICNRQLLVSNAFEALIQERFPKSHRIIRKNYDKIGDLVHRHYHLFQYKIISDIVYWCMKPLELAFLITLYLCDENPENRISKQYMGLHPAYLE